MKIDNKFVIAVVLIVVMLAAVAISQAGNNCDVPASKAAVAGENIEFIEFSTDGEETYGPVLLAEATIKTANKKDLVIAFTSENTLITDTAVLGSKKAGLGDEDVASIVVWVEVDGDGEQDTGDEAFPGSVTFAERVQYMDGRLSDITWTCNPYDPDVENPEDCVLELPEYVRLMLETTSANGFNYLALNMESGCHDIKVWATVELKDGAIDEVAEEDVAAIIGKRTLVIQEVRLINDKVTV